MKTTIHIFGYGEAQIISHKTNFKTNISDFEKLQSVIDDIKSKKPADKKEADYHSINIFQDLKVDYIAKLGEGLKFNITHDNSSYSIPYKNLDANKLDALMVEFSTLLNESMA